MKKFFLHLGPHKTATTFIQNSFSTSLTQEITSGYNGFTQKDSKFIYLSANQPNVEITKKILTKQLHSEGDEGALDIAVESMKSLIATLDKYDTAFLINENFMGPQVGQHSYKKGLYDIGFNNPLISFIDKLNKSLKEIDVELTVFLSTRRQDGFLKSTYLNLIADGMKFQFPKFFSKVENLILDWGQFIGEFKKVAKTVVIPFELVIEDEKKFVAEFIKHMDPDLTIEMSNKKREALSAKGLEIALKINYLETETKTRKKIIRILKNQLPKKEYGSPDFSEFLTADFYKNYVELNKVMFKEHIDPSLHYICDKYYL